MRVASMKSTRVVVVLLDAGGDGEDVGVEDDVLGREADLLGQDAVGALADRDLALDRRRPGPSRRTPSRRPPRRTGAPAAPGRRNSSSPSFRLIELTIALPCTHFRPASMTDHFELSTMIGTRAISGSAAIRLRNVVIACSPSSRPSSMLTSMMLAPPRPARRATASALLVVVRLDQAREALRAGDVGPLADHDEVRSRAGAMSGSSPESRSQAARARAACAAAGRSTASAIARMCSGVVPQQPPTMFTQPCSANSPQQRRRMLGRSRRSRRRRSAGRRSGSS